MTESVSASERPLSPSTLPGFVPRACAELPILWIVVPVYNEELVLAQTVPMFLEELDMLIAEHGVSVESLILFVDDSSTDATWQIVSSLARREPHVAAIRQSRNRGHQSSVLAGLMEARGQADIAICIDCDGQDDIHAMEEMVDRWWDGYDVVYGVRSSRKTDSWAKRFTAQSYYKMLSALGAEVVYNHADYRLMSARLLQALASYEEVNLFLRGLIPLVGFPSCEVYYERHERMAGKSHYPLSKMLALALDGVTSLSTRPIHLVMGLGFIVTGLSMVGIIYALVSWALGQVVSGWTSMVMAVLFLGGVQLLSIGTIGEYVGKTYMETKHRPRYLISEREFGESESAQDESK